MNFEVSTVFKEYGTPKSPITDTICNTELVHLPAADPARLELFGRFVPRISNVDNWKTSYSFDKIRRIMLGDMLRSKGPVSAWQLSLTCVTDVLQLQVWDAEEVSDDPEAAASVILGLDAKENAPQAYLMNTPIPSLESQITPTRELHESFAIILCQCLRTPLQHIPL